MSNDMRDFVDGLLAYALRFANDDDKPASGACWDLIAQARRSLREMERQPGPREDAADAEADRAAARARALEVLCSEGLTIGECMKALTVPADDPYVSAALEVTASNDNIEIDEFTTTERVEGGAWVLSWLWIGDRLAGVFTHSEMLEEVWRRAGDLLTGEHGLDDDTAWLRNNQVLWLDDVCCKFFREIDRIESAQPRNEPGAVVWVDERRHALRFVPSEAVLQLLALARQAGLRPWVAQHCERFCAQYGSVLDAILAANCVG